MRRVVTGHDALGRSVVVSDEPPVALHFDSLPGLSTALLWTTEPGRPADCDVESHADQRTSVVPPVGGSRLVRLTFPPDSAMASPHFDVAAFVAENAAKSPDLAELMEPDGMHTTPSVDYAVLLEGELHLQTGDGTLTTLRPGDVVIQNATRHTWRNRSDRPAVLLVALIGTPQT